MTEMTAQNPPARRQTTVPLIVLVLFVLAAGTFGTLWMLERGEHSNVSEQLTVVRAEADGVKAKLSAAEKKQTDLDKKLTEAANARQTAQTTASSNRDCADAARQMRAAAARGSEAEYNTKFDDAYFHCGGAE